MPDMIGTKKQLVTENKELRERLEKAEASVRDILSGEADALFVSGAAGAEIYTVTGADQAYRTLIENMREGALTLTPNGIILYANRRFAEMLGTTLEKVMGSDIFSWFAPESRQVAQTLLRNDMADKHSEELILTPRDGTQRFVYVAVNRMVLDEMPDAYGMVVFDLTDQKRNEVILAEEKLARAILEQAADAIVLCDQSGRIMRASKQAQMYYDSKLFGQHFTQAFPLRRPDGTAIFAAGSINPSTCKSMVARLEHKTKEFDFLVSVGHLKGEHNKLLGSVVTMTDITEHKTMERALRTSEELSRCMFTQAPVGIASIDSYTGTIYEFNSRFAEISGRKMEERGSISWLQFTHPDDIQLDLDNMALLNAGKVNGFQMEKRYLHPDGTAVWVDMTISQLTVGDKTNSRHLCMIQDITARKNSEARIKYLNRVLSVLSDINTLIVRVNDRQVLYRKACDIAITKGGFRVAFIVIVNQNTMLPLSVTFAGKDRGLLAPIKNFMSSSDNMKKTLVMRAMRENIPVIVNDVQNDPSVLLRKQHIEAGIGSMTILPLAISGKAVGAFALYASENDFFQKDEMKLLTELADDVAFAVDYIKNQERLNYLAYYDVVTGLANRSLFIERLALHMRNALSGGHKLAIGLIDLERFKNMNDSMGREAGDSLLRQVGDWLAHKTGDSDLAARIDADRFAIVLPKIKSDGNLANLIGKLIADFLGHSFRFSDSVLRIGVKAGISVFPEDGGHADILLINAEAALKKAKTRGDRFLFYKPKMNESVIDNLAMENKLRQAVDNEEFVLHYQPKVNLLSGEITGVEALIRWNDPGTGLVPPKMFIPILEETGLIDEVGRWALHKAITDHLCWRAAGLDGVRVAVNVSPLQLRNIEFINDIGRLISMGSNTAAGLELEITEGIIMENVQHSISSLQVIRDLGITIAIDDFGTGFSSLNYLSQLPIDTLKIDRSFINVMTTGPRELSLVSAIITLGHSLSLKVVAEGVETEQQLQLLRSLGCNEMQGYLFSEPVPADILKTKYLAPPPTGTK